MTTFYKPLNEHHKLKSVHADTFATYYFKQSQEHPDIFEKIKFRQAYDNRVSEVETYNFNQLKIREVLFDSDGVFADWTGYMLTNHLTTYPDIRTFNECSEKSDVLQEVYAKDPNAFAKLDTLPDVPKLIEIFKLLKKSNLKPRILTAVGTEHPDFEMVKQDKLNFFKNLGLKEADVIVVRESSDKKKLAQAGSLLIDDFGDNCREWVSEDGLAIKWAGHQSLPVLAELLRERNNLDISTALM